MSLSQIAATAVMAKVGTSERPYRLFVVSESATALLTLLAAGILQLPAVVVVAVFVARSAFLALAATAEETIQFSVIPAAAVGFVFGASQTAFLVGDALGGVVGAVLWNSAGPWELLLIAGVVTGINAFLLPLLLRQRSAVASSWAE
ncbi:hypothetical protein [Corynebacterium lowii]|uniref:Major facilitator superfamily (MFS) profile domain-containing protein n=1 Tax=Corynebacterium lowii TaxID=1544413 RepID=A0A0Q0Z7X3_9CORY|nr:hypothetical protein [Corynebacterium lowii]KQB85683.1 hypothetical protein Clow_01815 [Corynebacterium lowii]MDP9850983.1 putative MFS family arabinose efflux permease [Corynebacterium lowii]